MLMLIQWLIFGHIHHWRTLESGDTVRRGGDMPVGRYWHQECTKCGKRRYYQS